MQFTQFTAARADTGAVLPYARCTVYLTGTSTKASLFLADGVTATSNPVVATITGLAGFAAADGTYDFAIASADGNYSVPLIQAVQAADLIALRSSVSSKLGGLYSVLDYSSISTAAAASVPSMIFPSGAYTLTASTTFPMPLNAMPGAVITVPTGMTLTINGQFTAVLAQCFNCVGTGKVVLNPATTLTGYPEWWGAVPGGADCYTAIMACYLASRRTALQAASYFTSQTLIWDQPSKTIEGVSQDYNGAEGQCTRILINGGAGNTLQIGPSSAPAGGFNNFPQNIVVRDLHVSRTAAPTIASGCVSVAVQYTLGVMVERVKGAESITCWHLFGNVNANINYCKAFRSTAGTGVGTDKWIGFDVDGSISIGAAGGNASMWIDRANASCGGTPPLNSAGMLIHGAITDTYVRHYESVTWAVGLRIIGSGATTTGGSVNEDVHIEHAVCDAHSVAGIYISDIAADGSVELVSPYAALGLVAGITPVANIYILNSGGSVRVSGGQVPCGNTSVQGVTITGSNNVDLDGPAILNVTGAVSVGVYGSTGCRIRPKVINRAGTATVVLQVGTSSRCVFEPYSQGAAGQNGLGIQVIDATSGYNEYRLSGMDPAGLTGSASANKLVINGTQVTVAGVCGTTSLASGIMA